MSERILSLQLRPKTLSGLYGQEKIVSAIRNHMAKRPPRTWLFSGEPGTGKTTLAQIMSIAYQCGHMKLWGDPCIECRKQRSDYAIHEINAAQHSGVEEIESVIGVANHYPMNGRKRVMIIDECQALSAAAWKALLKPTEETHEHAVWIFCTSDLRKVPAANQRRPVKYALRALKMGEVEAFLKKSAEKGGVTQPLPPLIDVVHTVGISAPGVLLQALEKYAAGNSPAESVAGADGESTDLFNLCKALTNGDWPTVKIHLKDATPDSARLIRAFASSWLKGRLMSDKMRLAPKEQEAAAQSLIELATPPYEDAAMLNWLHGVLWKVARRHHV
jgi:hypothetical protein